MLEVKNISYSYPQKKVLDGVNFQVDKNDIFAILGKNAAGKTTLISCMTGLLEANEGSITVDGESITAFNSNRYFGVMHDLTDMYLKMTPYEYLHLVGVFFNVADGIEDKISSLAAKFEFEEHLYTPLKKCSLGTKKKVSFCAAIIHEPRFVILDEPFDSIDPIVCYEMKKYLTEYAKEDGTVIVTSHALDLIQNFCSKYIIIHDKHVAASGNMDDNAASLEEIFISVVGAHEED